MIDLCVKKSKFLLLGQFKPPLPPMQTMGNKKSAETCGNLWLAIIDRLRTETYEDVINLTGLLDELTTHTT